MPIRLLLLLLALGIAVPGWAQNPCFTIDGDSVGCAPFTVRLRNCVPSNAQGGIIYYPHTSPPIGSAGNPGRNGINTFGAIDTVRYTQPGTYQVTQLLSLSNRQISRRVVVLPRTTPTLTVTPCSDRRVRIQITKVPGERFIIDYGNGIIRPTVADNLSSPRAVYDTIYQYPPSNPPGSRMTISVRGYYGCSDPQTAQVTLLGAQLLLPDTLHVRPNPNQGTVQVNLAPPVGFDNVYRIELEQQNPNNTYTALATAGTPTPRQWQFTLARREAQPRLRLLLKDACNTVLYSVEFRHLTFQAQVVPNANRLTWSLLNHPLGETYRLIRNRLPIFTSGNITTYTDRQIFCRVRYCYQATVTINKAPGVPSSFVTLYSADTCVQGQSNITPGPVEDLLASVASNGPVRLTWDRPLNYAVSDYTVSRAPYPDTAASQFGNVARTTAIAWDDASTPTIGTYGTTIPRYCYQVSYRDSCGNVSRAASAVCPVSLALREERPINVLTYNTYIGFPLDSAVYTLQFLDANFNAYRSVPLPRPDSIKINTYQDRERNPQSQIIRYRIQVKHSGTGEVSYSNIQQITQRLRVVLPNAFSPNNDGNNDVFKVVQAHITKFEMRIFSRWGEPVFRSLDPEQGWDGTLQGRACPGGAYLVIITGEDETGQTFDQRSTVTLVR